MSELFPGAVRVEGRRHTWGDREVQWRTIAEVEYVSGHVTFGCTDCGFTNDNWRVVLGHRTNHRDSTKGPRRKSNRKNLESVQELVARTIEGAGAEAERWKRRAIDAERRLAAMRRALGVGDQP